MNIYIPFLILLLFSFRYAQDGLTAEEIVNKSVEAHGGDQYQEAHFSFDFRKYSYQFEYDHGRYKYSRSLDDIKDVLTNDGFERYEAGILRELSQKKANSYANSVNSVHYFAFLPFFLNDEAVQKESIGSSEINGQQYYKVRVTFNKEGGGDDHDDIYVYWINKESYTMDYLAYSFHVNGGGVRFREAFNRRTVGGITFQDYVNYKDEQKGAVETMDALFGAGSLKELSKIELKNIKAL